jgi:hypothetical protein
MGSSTGLTAELSPQNASRALFAFRSRSARQLKGGNSDTHKLVGRGFQAPAIRGGNSDTNGTRLTLKCLWARKLWQAITSLDLITKQASLYRFGYNSRRFRGHHYRFIYIHLISRFHITVPTPCPY